MDTNTTDLPKTVPVPSVGSGDLLGGLDWIHDERISLDYTVMFGHSYDFFGLECLRQEAKGSNGNYLLWHNGGSNDRWSLYRDSDGALALDRFTSEAECKAAAERWCADVIA